MSESEFYGYNRPKKRCELQGEEVLPRTHSVTVKLSLEEREWFRRKSHWEGVSMSELLRRHIHSLISEEGYMRPPDDEPQDFGFEKEMMQFVVTIQED